MLQNNKNYLLAAEGNTYRPWGACLSVLKEKEFATASFVTSFIIQYNKEWVMPVFTSYNAVMCVKQSEGLGQRASEGVRGRVTGIYGGAFVCRTQPAVWLPRLGWRRKTKDVLTVVEVLQVTVDTPTINWNKGRPGIHYKLLRSTI